MNGPLKRLLFRITPDCRTVARLCSERLDRKLSWRERLAIRFHYQVCTWCIDYSDQVTRLHKRLCGQEESLADLKDQRLSDSCRQRICDCLQQEQNKHDNSRP